MSEKPADIRALASESAQIMGPGNFRVIGAACGFIEAEIDGQRRAELKAVRMFPLSLPDEYVSICDSAGKEIGVIRDLKEFTKAERSLIEQSLDHTYFMPKILKVLGVTERFHMVTLEVVTDRGKRLLDMSMGSDDVVHLGLGRVVIRDIDHNRYEIENLDALDQRSRAMIDPHI